MPSWIKEFLQDLSHGRSSRLQFVKKIALTSAILLFSAVVFVFAISLGEISLLKLTTWDLQKVQDTLRTRLAVPAMIAILVFVSLITLFLISASLKRIRDIGFPVISTFASLSVLSIALHAQFDAPDRYDLSDLADTVFATGLIFLPTDFVSQHLKRHTAGD